VAEIDPQAVRCNQPGRGHRTQISRLNQSERDSERKGVTPAMDAGCTPLDPKQGSQLIPSRRPCICVPGLPPSTLLCSQAVAYCAVRDITGARGIAGNCIHRIFSAVSWKGIFHLPPPNRWLYNHPALF